MTEDHNQILREYLNNPLAPEIYRLWYEYLKKNKDYEKLCEYVSENKKLPPEQQFSLPPEGLKRLPPENFKGLFETFICWGDIHSFSCEDKLVDICNRIKNPGLNDPTKMIIEADKLDQVYPASTLEELYVLHRETIPANYLSLEVPINAPISDLVKQFLVIIKRKQQEIVGGMIRKSLPFPKATKVWGLTKDRINHLKKYLEILKYWNKYKKWEKVMDIMDPEFDKVRNEGVYRHNRDKAKRIIKNAGKNIFPGKYGKA